MSVTIGSDTFARLTAQPFGYDETDTRSGQTAAKWTVNGLLTPSEWLDLLAIYDAWRDLRIEDPPSITSQEVGNTVTLSGTGPGGQTWTEVDCWFSSAPQAEQSGAYLAVSFELVDAAQALEVLLKQEEQQEEEEDLPDLGTITVGTTVLTLLKPIETYGATPQLELTASGVHYISGPLVAFRVRDIEGTTDASGWSGILSWFESQVVTTPATGAWFPISAPTASAANKIVDGVKTIEYTVSIQLGQVI